MILAHNTADKIKFSVVTLSPEYFDAFKTNGVVARAIKANLLQLDCVQLRDFANDPRRTVDDRPCGGGDGMVLKPDAAFDALRSVVTEKSHVVYLSPAGKVFDQACAKRLSQHKHIVLLCGRYAGFDRRVVDQCVHEEISIGDFVLSGGEIPAMCLIDAVSRYVPGVLGNEESVAFDSFADGLLEAPQYTKPLDWNGQFVPEVLLCGDHKKMKDYNRRQKIKLTANNRPDLILLAWDSLNKSEQTLVQKIWKHRSSLNS